MLTQVKVFFLRIPNRSRIPLPPIPNKSVKPCKKKEPKWKWKGSKKDKYDKHKSRKLVIKPGKTISGPKTPSLDVSYSIDSEVVAKVGIFSKIESSDKKGIRKNNKKPEGLNHTVKQGKKKKKKNKGITKKGTTNSLSSILHNETRTLPPKTPERKFGKEDQSSTPPPIPARKFEIKEATGNKDDVNNLANSFSHLKKVKEDQKHIVSETRNGGKHVTGSSDGSARATGSNSRISILRNKYHKDVTKKVTYKSDNEEEFDERRTKGEDNNDDLALYGDERDETAPNVRKTNREDWETKRRALQRMREEIWAERIPTDDDNDDDDDDIYGGMSPYEELEFEEKEKMKDTENSTEDVVENHDVPERGLDKKKQLQKHLDRIEDVAIDVNDERNKEMTEYIENSICYSSKYTRNKHCELNKQEHNRMRDDHDDTDAVKQTPDVSNVIATHAHMRYTINKKQCNQEDSDDNTDMNDEADEDNDNGDKKDWRYYDERYLGFNWADPFHPDNIRPGLELCPVIVSNKGLGSRFPLRIEMYID